MTSDHARPEELSAALSLIFAHLRDDERHWRVAHVLRLLAAGDLDARGVFVLRDAGGVRAALLCSTVEGGGSLIGPPSDGAGAALVAHACAWLRSRGVRLTQCLLPGDEADRAAPLLHAGFAHVTDLLYLCHDLVLSAALTASPCTLRFAPYRPDSPDEFHDALLRSYEGTADCPELNGVRGIDEIIRGHKAQGVFDPDRWWLARIGGRVAGVVLLMEQPGVGDWDVVYVGVVPQLRGRGLGREMMIHAMIEARAAGAARLTLSVDRRNEPARRLYQALGFEEYDRRLVLLALWP